MRDMTDAAIQRFREEGFLEADHPEALVADLVRIACGGESDPDAARPGETSDQAYLVKLRDVLDELSSDGDGKWTAQVVLGELARQALRERLITDEGVGSTAGPLP